ncbi:MAG TPA: FMN-binding protein [Arachnia sp.]|nr:FMN-binding protein [Arachnia sp.]
MRTIIAALMGTISGVVLLFSYHTSTGTQAATVAATSTGDGQSATSTPNAGESSPSDATESSSDDGTGASSTTGSVSGTFTGAAVETRYGAVQVEITVEDGVITSSEAIQYPNRDRHDQQINSYAVPVLNAEAVDAQSADIDSVSGATFTSVGYAQSLQSALDEAFQ